LIDLKRFGRPVLLAMVAAGVLALLSVTGAYRDFERLFVRDAGQLDEAQTATALSRAYRQPVLTPYVELAVSFGIAPAPDRLREKLELNGRTMRFVPLDVVVYRHAALLALAGEREAAQLQFARAARAYPKVLAEAADALREHARQYPAEMAPL